ncbi:MAG TPA: CpaF family protein [Dehalococcoidia bacterium]|nr:CpaF family protein [Dehalococcoidia bacterium]
MTSWQPGRMSDRPGMPSRPGAHGGTGSALRATPGRYNEDMEQLIFRIHQMLIEELDADQIAAMPSEERRKVVETSAETLLKRELPNVGGITRDQIVSRVVDEVVGLGPIDALLRDPSISEVMVNAPEEVFFEREGILYLSDVRFRDQTHIIRVIERVIAPIGRRIDESSPMVDARLPDGSRVNVIIPPVAPKSPSITIRKFRADKLSMDDLVTAGSVTADMVEFLKACVRLKLNIIVSGGTGTGKTTFLNALSAYIPESERIVTIEDPIEIKIQQPHVVSLEARPPNVDGKGEITQRDLLRNTLRMRPDRIIIGEVRGPEAFDMLNAMNTGHEGSLSTVHANTPRDGLARIENMVLMASLELPDRAIREQMASALDVIVQLQRHSDGVRRVTAITECTGMEGDIITLQDLFMFKQSHVDSDGKIHGRMAPTGIRPSFAERFSAAGITLTEGLFLARSA